MCENDPCGHDAFRPERPLEPRIPEPPPTDPDAVLHFWEIEPFFKCPIVGICLTGIEQKQLLKKAGVALKEKSPFEIHEILVASGQSNNRISRKVDRWLAHKFGRQAEALRELTEDVLMAQWSVSFESGQYASVFWALASRADLSRAAKRRVFAAVHMSMHAAAEEEMKTKRRLLLLEGERIVWASRARGLKHSFRQARKENRELRRAQLRLEARLAAATKENTERQAALRAGPGVLELESENRRLSAELRGKEQQVLNLERQCRQLGDRLADLEKDMSNRRQALLQTEKEADEMLHFISKASRCNPACPAFDLCRKRVLLVGGIDRMKSLYRGVVEGGGGMFEYHNGCVKGGSRQLENRLKRADIVLCPVSCNSHAACSLVKRLGKKHGKPVHMMAGFSLNAVSRMLGQNGCERVATTATGALADLAETEGRDDLQSEGCR